MANINWSTVLLFTLFLATSRARKCPPRHYQCGDTQQCIAIEYVCDGFDDCGYDELNCKVCTSDGFHCDGRCIRAIYLCDSVNDCADGSDEARSQCDGEHRDPGVHCEDGTTRRIGTMCDGRPDCHTGQDELGCTATSCKTGAFFCSDGCFAPSKRCDGIVDCSTGLDERYCEKWRNEKRRNKTRSVINTEMPLKLQDEKDGQPPPGVSLSHLWVLYCLIVLLVVGGGYFSVGHQYVRRFIEPSVRMRTLAAEDPTASCTTLAGNEEVPGDTANMHSAINVDSPIKHHEK